MEDKPVSTSVLNDLSDLNRWINELTYGLAQLDAKVTTLIDDTKSIKARLDTLEAKNKYVLENGIKITKKIKL